MNRKVRENQIFNMVLFSIFAAIILLLSLVPNIGFIKIPPVAITIVHIPVLIGIMVLPLVYAVGLGFVFGLGSFIAAFIYADNPVDMAFQNPLISILPRILFAIIGFFIFFGLRKLQKVKYGDAIIFTIVSVITVVFLYFGGYALAKTIDEEGKIQLMNILLPIFVGLGGLLIGGYYMMINSKKLKNNIAIPSSVMIATLFHTILVLSALSIFNASAFDLLGTDLMTLLRIVIGTNGFIEIIAGLIVATPVALAIITAFPERISQDFIFKKEEKKENEHDLTV